MKLICTMPVRNEAWVLGLSLRAVLMWCDEVVVLNHASTDGTSEIIERVCSEQPGRVVTLHADDDRWAEMSHRQWLLDTARHRGATHIAIVDADEVLTGNLLPRIRSMIEAHPPRVVMTLPWLCLWRGITHYRSHDNSPWSRADVSTAFCDHPSLHWATRNGYEFHHRQPIGTAAMQRSGVGRSEGGLMHLQFVRWRALLAKQALYKMREAIDVADGRFVRSRAEIDRTYNPATDEHGLRTASVDPSWWRPYEKLLRYLDLDEDKEPWQERKAKQLIAQYGADFFAGLDLFGVVG